MTKAGPQAVSCPQCGGENPLAAGEVFFACAFCDTSLFVDRARVVGHYHLPRLLDREQAAAALRRWMAGNQTVKDLDTRSTLRSLDPSTFPIWLFRTGPMGRGTVHAEPAAPTPIPDLADLEVPAGELEPYREPEEGVAATPPSVPLATARAWVEERGAGEVRESSLVEVPIWNATYLYRGESYKALVEGSTGRVLASIYPEKAESPYVLVAGLGLLVFGVLGLAIFNPLVKLAAFGVAAVPLGLLAWWVTRRV